MASADLRVPFESMDEVRRRVLDATVRCAMEYSLQRTTVEEISIESGVSRATIYRHFPAGREAIVGATVADQVDAFLIALAEDVSGATSTQELLVTGLMAAHRRLKSHQLFARGMAVGPELVLPSLTTESNRGVEVIGRCMAPFVSADEPETPEVQILAQCDHLARLFLSHVESPGSWDLTSPEDVRELVETQFLIR